MDFGPRRRKKIWYTAVVGGVAGATSLAAVAVVTNVAGLRSGAPAASSAQLVRPVADDKADMKRADKRYDSVVDVPCDPDDLIAALIHANADGGGVLKLAEHCTYTLTRSDGSNGLPPIVQPVTIKGNGATVVRAASADPFRILNVSLGGDLKLFDLTVKGGQTTESSGGAGMLVNAGGQATTVDSRFTRNISSTVGGGIANYGITKVTGEKGYGDWNKDSKDGKGSSKDEKSWSKDGKDGSDPASAWGKDGADWGDQSSMNGEWYSSVDNNTAQGGGLTGGGIYNARFLTVDKTRLSYNNAVGPDGSGGGLANISGGVAVLTKAVIDHNRAGEDGGGVATLGGTLTFEHSYVANNATGDVGGGIYSSTAASVYVQSTTVRHNSSGGNGGGILNTLGSQLVVDNSKVNENTAFGDGGGVRNSIGGDAVLRNSEIDLNKAIGASSIAGGISNSTGNDSSVALTGTRVAENLATNAPGGIENNNSLANGFSVDDESVITKNRPTNCEGSPQAVPNCFG